MSYQPHQSEDPTLKPVSRGDGLPTMGEEAEAFLQTQKPITMKFDEIVEMIKAHFRDAPEVHPPRWHSMNVSKLAHMVTRELLHYSFHYQIQGESLDALRAEIHPNLPWADDHFLRERVSGSPLNPGTTWQWWPWASSANTLRRMDEAFDHSYAERYWPRYAGQSPGGVLNGSEDPLKGIRFRYGDLEDLVTALAFEPLTRQAYLPVWFPEDLGAIVDKKARVPCSLGYHFILRNNRLDIVYYLRSCDFIRHFRDDVYLTIRLLFWVLQQCRLASPENDWDQVAPGRLIMHITSLHMFKGDYQILFKGK